jgi:hypothetical protein
MRFDPKILVPSPTPTEEFNGNSHIAAHFQCCQWELFVKRILDVTYPSWYGSAGSSSFTSR